MKCDGCGNENAYRLKMRSDSCMCDKCGGLTSSFVPDIYFKEPYLDPNLAHPNRPWEKNGVWVRSRAHKAALMKEQGLREAGDRKHGARIEDKSLQRRMRDNGWNIR